MGSYRSVHSGFKRQAAVVWQQKEMGKKGKKGKSERKGRRERTNLDKKF